MKASFDYIKWIAKVYPRQSNPKHLLMKLYLFWTERLTSFGRVATVLFFLAGLMEFAPGLGVGLSWVTLYLCCLFTCLFWPRPRLGTLVAEATFPEFPKADTPWKIHLQFKNPLPYQGVYSLFPNRTKDPFQTLESPQYTRQSRHIFTYLMICRYRCAYTLESVSLLIPGPLGLTQKRYEVLVNQSFFCFEAGESRWNPRFLASSRQETPQGNQGSEWSGLRPYQSGDPVNRIHHKAWARTGKPVVREEVIEAGDQKGTLELKYNPWISNRYERLAWETELGNLVATLEEIASRGYDCKLTLLEEKPHSLSGLSEILPVLSTIEPKTNNPPSANLQVPNEFGLANEKSQL